ncbi:hypothetical protein RRG08_049699 [Elysia crispata]|uniref:Uncharacterized protein n=1 Tax=Elysia crispata TaxID=231223 RepID=A0AAE1DZX5_9GAST|nr:hypothetical protein RRG08_049699 [Elysia crispata]
MKFLSTLAALVCLGTALALKCGTRKDFSAASFDAINFTPGRSYHDVANGIILYENQLDAQTSLFLQAEGIFYVRNADGSCLKQMSELGDFEISEFLHYTDRAGIARTGVADTSDKLFVKLLVNEVTCFTEFSRTTFSSGGVWSYIHTDHNDLTSTDSAYMQEVRSQFEQDNCDLLTS